MPVLPIQQGSLKCTVKNTFIDLVPADLEEQPELNLHWMGAKTCMARFSQAAPLHVPGDTFMGFSSEAHSDVSDASGEQTGLSSPGKPAGCSVHLGISLSVPCAAEPSPASIRESARVAVVGAAVDHEKGCTFIDLRVCLQGTNFAILGPDGTPGTVPSGIVVQPIDVKCSSAGEQGAGTGAPCKDSTIMVCRHWRSRGWCRYQATCKFQHPEHKRGVTMKGAAKGSAGSSQPGRAGGQSKCRGKAEPAPSSEQACATAAAAAGIAPPP